jgi:hypothetical protein
MRQSFSRAELAGETSRIALLVQTGAYQAREKGVNRVEPKRILLTKLNSPEVIVVCKRCGLERNPDAPGAVCNCGNRGVLDPRQLATYTDSAHALIIALKNVIEATDEKRFPFKISLQYPGQLESGEQAEKPNPSSDADLGLKKGKWDR